MELVDSEQNISTRCWHWAVLRSMNSYGFTARILITCEEGLHWSPPKKTDPFQEEQETRINPRRLTDA